MNVYVQYFVELRTTGSSASGDCKTIICNLNNLHIYNKPIYLRIVNFSDESTGSCVSLGCLNLGGFKNEICVRVVHSPSKCTIFCIIL